MSEQEIYIELMNRPDPADRCRFLDQVCAGNEPLRNRIEKLIRQSDQLGSFLEKSPLALAATADISVATEQPGTLLGPYKLLEQIGEGGMGVVYMAQQIEPVKRKVALKVIKPGMDTKQVIARFEAERQALALMDHPNIARIYDAGTTGGEGPGTSDQEPASFPLAPGSRPLAPSAARPFFVMELVRGIPITDYCDKQRLNTQDRLKPFLDVCHAVQHAHLKGIIHRDLKPSNVLVTLHDGSPVVKVIDFGVAKALNQELTERTLFTQFSQMVGTPLYMSPEQAELSGLDIDTRTDVYSLGVLLYELLTGTTPIGKDRLKSATFDEMRRIIREEEPETISNRIARTRRVRETHHDRRVGSAHQAPRPLGEAGTTPNAWSQRPGEGAATPSIPHSEFRTPHSTELDWIAAKSLEKDRSRRYESASALAADIQRYLSGDPVLAHPPTTMYRFQKFARKHNPALVMAAAVAICLILGTTVSAWQAVRATTAEAQANANQVQAQANAKKADEKAQEATAQRDEAQKQRDEVRALNEKLQAAQAQQRSTVYTANMILAQRAWDAGDSDRAGELLELQRPGPGRTDLRGFEWQYLHRLCHADLLTLKGHTAGVSSVAYSPDGRRIASAEGGAEGGCVKVWDAQTGKELLTIEGGSSYVAFSPDGKRLAAGSTSDYYEAKVWSAEDGRELLTLKIEGGLFSQVTFSPDGQWLATSNGAMIRGKHVSSSVTIWHAHTGESRRTFGAETDQELLKRKVLRGHHFCIAFSPDSKRLVTGEASSAPEQEKLVRVWDVQTGQEVLTCKGHTDSIHGVAFGPDGKRIASASSDNTLKLWDGQSGEELFTLPGHTGSVWSTAFSPDGKRLVSASYDRTVKLWNAETGQELATFKGHSDRVGSVAFSPDGKYVASGSGDKSVKIWDAAASSNPMTLQGGVTSITSVAFSPNGQRLASVGRGGPEGRGIGTAKVWDPRTGRELATLKGLASSVWQNRFNVSFNSGGTRVAVVADGQPWPEARVFDAQSGEEVLALKGHATRLTAVAYSPDGKHIASASLARRYSSTSSRPGFASVPTGGIGIWDAESGKLLRTLAGHTDGTGCVTFSPDGTRLASGGGDEASNSGEVKIWNARTGEQLFVMKHGGEWAGINAVAFSPDGQRLASASYGDRTVKLWDAQTGQETLVLKGHSANVSGLAYSPDGNRIATTAGDKMVKLWNAQSGDELLTLEGHGDYNGIAFSPDGNLLACGGPDGTIKIYDATPVPEQP